MSTVGIAAALMVTTTGSTHQPVPVPPLGAAGEERTLLPYERHLTDRADRAGRTRHRAVLGGQAHGIPPARKKRPQPRAAVAPRRTAERAVTRVTSSRPVRKARPVPVKRVVRVAAGARPGARFVLAYAYRQIGKPYVLGAAGPAAFDCSGLTLRAYRLVGVQLPHRAAAQRGRFVSRGQARAGDLVKWGGYHVGIYAGRGMVIHAPKPGDRVKKSRLWGAYRFVRLL